MVVDHLEHLALYQSLNPHIHTCIEFMMQHDLSQMEVGKYPVDGKNAFVMISEYDSKEEKDCAFEAHLNYADIQIILSGVESFGYQYKSDKFIKEITQSYNPDKDVEKYNVSDYTKIRLSEGMFALVFPEDLHMPNMKFEQSVKVKKAVFKILVKTID